MKKFKNNQEFFDKVTRHLLTQKVKAMQLNPLGDDQCLYLDSNGNKCAIGCCIPNGHEAQEAKMSVSNLMDCYEDIRELFSNVSINVLETLQSCHDSYEPDKWFNRLRQIARDYNLDTSVLEQYAP